MSESPYLHLGLTSQASGSAITFLEWAMLQSGTSASSNANKIDTWASQASASLVTQSGSIVTHISASAPHSGHAASSHTHGGGDITSQVSDAGTVDGVDSSQIVYGDNANKSVHISNGNLNDARASGFYDGATLTNSPDGSADWFHIIHKRHYNTANNYAAQIGARFYATNGLYYRQINNGTPTAWQPILLGASNSRPGVTRLYRWNVDDAYHVRTYHDGSNHFWLMVYNGDSDTPTHNVRVNWSEGADTLDGYHYNGIPGIYVPLASVGNVWNGASNYGVNTYDYNATNYGVPSGARAIYCRTSGCWVGAANNKLLLAYPPSTILYGIVLRGTLGYVQDMVGIVGLASNVFRLEVKVDTIQNPYFVIYGYFI